MRVLLLELHHARIEDLQWLALRGNRLPGKRRYLIDSRTELVTDVEVKVGIDAFGGERAQKVAQPLDA